MRIDVDHGTFAYRRGPRILSDITLTFETPGTLSVLGANGAGKTTFLRCLLGFERWTSGATRIDGVDIAQLPGKTLWSRVGYVAQAKAPAFSYSVRELVLLGRNARIGTFALPSAADRERVEESLELVGIAHLGNRLCHEISGGQYQLALVARALVADPELLVLDEPESNLDYKNQLRILEVLARLTQDKGLGAIINTHYPAHAFEACDRALLFYPDKTYAFGPTRDVLTEENLSRSFSVGVRITPLNLPERPGFAAVTAVPKN